MDVLGNLVCMCADGWTIPGMYFYISFRPNGFDGRTSFADANSRILLPSLSVILIAYQQLSLYSTATQNHLRWVLVLA